MLTIEILPELPLVACVSARDEREREACSGPAITRVAGVPMCYVHATRRMARDAWTFVDPEDPAAVATTRALRESSRRVRRE